MKTQNTNTTKTNNQTTRPPNREQRKEHRTPGGRQPRWRSLREQFLG